MSAPVARRVEDITLRGEGWEAYIDQNDDGTWTGHMHDQDGHNFSLPYQSAAAAYAWVEGACIKHPAMIL